MRLKQNTAACCLLAVAFVFAAPPLPAGESLTPHRAQYKVKISVLSGRLTTELRATDTGYSADHRVEPTGFADLLSDGEIRETSEFNGGDNGMLPVHYTSVDTITKDKTRADLRFDWTAGEMAGEINGEEVQQLLDRLMHDRVSIQYALMHDLMTGDTAGEYLLFDIDEFKPLLVRQIGEKRVKVPAGSYDVVGISHQAQGSSRVTTLWCAKELDYLPVLIEQHRKGKRNFHAKLVSYEPTES